MLTEGEASEQFTILQYNIHSLINFEVRMRLFLQELGDLQWDLVIFTETWREEKNEAWEAQDGHTWLGSGGVRGSRGVGFLLHKRWQHKEFRAVTERLGVLDVSVGSTVLSLLGIYMPHGSCDDDEVEAAYSILENELKSATARGNKCVVAGDFNAEVGSWREGGSDSSWSERVAIQE